MTEYRIVAKLDPSGVTAGSAKVKQDLRGLDAAATATGKNLEAAGRKGKKANDDIKDSAKGAAMSQAQMEAATLRVLQAVDAEAAEQTKLNRLLRDAEALHKQGAITQNQLVRVQTMVTQGVKANTVSLGQQRAGLQQTGQQVQDWTQQLSLGINPLVVLAQQGGQTATALQQALGGTGKAAAVAGFIAGPWGSLILAGVTVLGMLIYKNIELGNELDKNVAQLKKDAHETEVTRQAKELFNRTLEGQIVLQRELNTELERNLKTQQQIERGNLAKAYGSREGFYQERNKATGELSAAEADARAKRAAANAVGGFEGEKGTASTLRQAAAAAEARVAALQARIKTIDANIATAERTVRAAEIPIAQRQVKSSLDESAAATDRYQRRLGELNEQRVKGAITDEKYRRDLRAEEDLLKRTTDAIAKKNREERQSDGVSRFKTRQQAIGIAGRELQSGGLRVSENEQFGGVKGAHKSTGHGQYAIDVNSGTGVTEANVPDLKKRFDQLARRYQARGYRVLWNGQVYEANGNGPSGPIRGSDKHYDHMHVEAPQTIVGKATGASTESQTVREDTKEATAAEQQRDFIQQVVDQAATRGTGSQTESLKARIDKTLADFKRRFDRVATPGEQASITTALTDADARETAQRFDEAYVQPLARLAALQGKTGQDRAILNAQLQESARLGRELSPIEKVRIATSIIMTDQLEREAQVLQDVNAPLEQYKAQINVLNALLAKGAISQAEFNTRVGALNFQQQGRQQDERLGLGDEAGRRVAEMQLELDQERALLEARHTLGIISEENYQKGLTEVARREGNMRLDVERQIMQTRLASAQEITGSLMEIARASLGEQSAVYKAMFVAQKAFAIASAVIDIQKGIASAAATPFPANLAAIASVIAATASIVSNIQSVSLNLADGGQVRGPGGPRGDKIPANLSDREYVMPAHVVDQPGNLAMLEAMRRGAVTSGLRNARNDNTAATRSGEGGDVYQLTFGDVVVNPSSGMTAADGRSIGRDVRDAVRTIAREEIANAKRSGGALTTTRSSVLTS